MKFGENSSNVKEKSFTTIKIWKFKPAELSLDINFSQSIFIVR